MYRMNKNHINPLCSLLFDLTTFFWRLKVHTKISILETREPTKISCRVYHRLLFLVDECFFVIYFPFIFFLNVFSLLYHNIQRKYFIVFCHKCFVCHACIVWFLLFFVSYLLSWKKNQALMCEMIRLLLHQTYNLCLLCLSAYNHSTYYNVVYLHDDNEK